MKAFFAGLIAALLGGSQVLAQIQTNATCAASFSWQENSLNQSPCLIAAYLQGACSTGVWTTPALPRAANGQKQAYFPPDATSRNLCTCSWAVYNLISACAACQDGTWLLWPVWSTDCAAANLIANQPFPQDIQVPSGTVIPEYAGKNPSTWTGNGFNLTEARAIGSHNIQISTTLSSSPTSSAPSSSNSSPSNDGGSAPAVGPIVGGVVGGILGLLLIAVFATFLLCPARFRRGQKAGATESQEKQPDGIIPQPPAGGSVLTYSTPPLPNSSHQELLAPAVARPPMAPRLTSSVYSFSTADHSVNSTLVPQLVSQPQALTAGPQAPWHQPAPEMMINSTPSPPNGSIYSGVHDTSAASTTGTSMSVRTFLTRPAPRTGHAHTLSDTSVTSTSSLLPRMQPGLWRQQSGGRNDVVSPYVLAPSDGTSGSQHQPDRKVRPNGLQYTPPPEEQTFSIHGEPSGSSDGSNSQYVQVPPGLLPPGPTTAQEAYGMLAPSLINDGDIEADRRTNMSPANASSILEAAPPYASAETQERVGLGGRGGMPLQRVDEYPEEKARYTNAAAREQAT